MIRHLAVFAIVVGITLSGAAPAAPIIFSAGGDSTAASIQATVDAFRVALGDPNNASAPGPLPGGRREINWDGGGPPVVDGTPPITPFAVFRDTRGATFTTPGTGLTQIAATGGFPSLDNLLNPSYATIFAPFSPNRLFTPIGSNITDVLFFLPGSNGTIAATVSGFGAVFSDVDLANSTQIEYFNAAGDSLFKSFVLAGVVPDKSFSFLGVLFDAGEQIARLRITTGNTALGPNDGSGVDVVVLDDVLYGEPGVRATVPAPSTLALLALGLAGLGFASRRKLQ